MPKSLSTLLSIRRTVLRCFNVPSNFVFSESQVSAMTLWARTQQLTGNYLRQVQELYSSRFPMEVRHSIANWLEAQNWYVCLVLFCISFTRSVLSTKMVVDLISTWFFTPCCVCFEIMRENYFWYFNCNIIGGVCLTELIGLLSLPSVVGLCQYGWLGCTG